MKRIILLLVLVSSLGFAQETVVTDVPFGYHMHDGFYLSLSGGPATGVITLDATNFIFKKMEFNGAGYMADLKVGVTLSEEQSLILSFDMINRFISNPSVTMDGKSVSATSSFQVSDFLIGFGITKYFMPVNIFITTSFGVSGFEIGVNGSKAYSGNGFALQAKVGKEWWIWDDWGLGLAAGLAYASADDQEDPDFPKYSGKLSTTKLFVELSVSFN